MNDGHRKRYQVPEVPLVLDFTGGTYEGAEVRLRGDLPLRMLFHLERLGEEGKIKELITELGENVLMDWNLEDKDGVPIPATADGLMSQSTTFGMVILEKWTGALKTGDKKAGHSPLGGTSPNGDTSAALSPVTESA